jgi:hypothetical protein
MHHLSRAALLVLSVTFVACKRTQSATRPFPPTSVAKTIVASTSEFREGLGIRIPREIAIEPKFGEGAAAAFAASLGRDVLDTAVLRAVSPAVAAMQDAQVVQVNDSPISEQFNVDAPVDLRAATSLLSAAGNQRARRYWRHYLRVEPVDATTEDWISEPGDNQADETMATARVVRTPGWRAIIARRAVVAIDSMSWTGDTLSISYRWRWAPSAIGVGFVSSDTLAADRVPSSASEAPLLSASPRRATASFIHDRDGWVPKKFAVATNP